MTFEAVCLEIAGSNPVCAIVALWRFSPRSEYRWRGRGCCVCLGVAVAQLVESRIVIPVVTGSSPVGHPQAHALFYASVAQLVEHRPEESSVTGSNPVGGTIIKNRDDRVVR